MAGSPRMAARGGLGRAWLALVAIALVAFALRVAVAARFQGLDAPPDAESNPDQVDYELFAWRLADGAGYTLESGEPTARRPPGTSFALAPVYALFGRSWSAGRLWFCALSAASCVVSGALAARLFGVTAGLLAAGLLAVLPGHFYYAMHFLSEAPFGLLIALSIALALRADRSDRRGAAAAWGAGLLFGLAVLTRPQVFFAGPLALLAALASGRADRGRRLRRVVAAGCAALLVVAPWIARNHAQLGKATLSTVGGFTFWGANNEVIAAGDGAGGWMPVDTLVDADHPLDGSEAENDAAAWRYGLSFLREHPGAVPGLLRSKLARHFSPFRATENRAVYWSFAAAWIAIAPLLAAGAVIGLARARAGATLLLLPMLSTLATALVFYGSIRFRDADAALYVIPAAAALAALAPASLRRRLEGAGA